MLSKLYVFYCQCNFFISAIIQFENKMDYSTIRHFGQFTKQHLNGPLHYMQTDLKESSVSATN